LFRLLFIPDFFLAVDCWKNNILPVGQRPAAAAASVLWKLSLLGDLGFLPLPTVLGQYDKAVTTTVPRARSAPTKWTMPFGGPRS
jgi:hypothetical protein